MEPGAAMRPAEQSVTEFTRQLVRLRGQVLYLPVRRNIMRAMNRSTVRRSLTPVYRAFGALAVIAASVFASFAPSAEAAEQGRLRLTPEQRRDVWERMTPEQREQWRNARSPDERQRALQGLSPEQRRETWQQLSPEQRELMMRRMTPEQRQNLRGQMTPDERQAMRQRFLERQQGNRPPGTDGRVPQPRQLSPEERQRLREQIEQARRDQYRRGNDGNKGANK
jgi:hypothetical protein